MIHFEVLPISTPALPLFHACFPQDDEEQTQQLLSMLKSEGVLLQGKSEGTVVCQGLLLSVSLYGGHGYYLYALGTHPSHRGRGYMRAWLEKAQELARKEARDFMLLIPATEELAKTYARAGFKESLPLAANLTGEKCAYRLPHDLERVAFDGDLEELRRRYDGTLSFPLFYASLFSVSDTTEIFYTEKGFCVCEKKSPDRCFTADKETLSLCEKCPSPYRALLYPLSHGLCTAGETDPLPR